MTVRPPRMPQRPRLLAPVLVIVAVVIVLAALGIAFYTDYLWFSSVHYTSVFTTVLRTRILLFFGFGLLMAALVAVNIVVAHRVRPPFRPMSLEQQNLERYRLAVEPYQRLALVGVSAMLGIFAGLSAAGHWQTWLMWRNRTDFGVVDPQFKRDVSYYAMTYPMQRFALGFVLTALVLALVAAAATHYLYGGLRLQTQGEKVSPKARAHLSVLLGLIVLAKAAAYYLDRFGLVFSNRGFVKGASYTDVNAVLPAKNILVGVAIICAVLFFANIRVRNILLPGGALALLVLAAVLLGGILPAYTQQFRVKPNEIQKEQEFIARNIEATRAAYGLDGVEVTQYGTEPPPASAAVSASTVPNARLLDPNRLAETFRQQKQDRQYFGVGPAGLDIDRYTVDGTSEDFVVAAREVDQTRLSANQRNWINERLTYTHGNGLIAARADQVDSEGNPIYSTPARVDQPRIYFGERSPSYSVVRTTNPEIDGPAAGGGDEQATFTYDGDGGIRLSSLARKLAYALKFREPNLLLSGAITKDSRIMYDREPRDRVKKVAPFLDVDQDAYPAAVDGRILWIVDAYTTTNGYPYAESVPFGDVTQDSQNGGATQKQVNYIRNSVKATVDAYTGEVTLYRFGDRDPVLESWDKAFGGIVKKQADMSPDLVSHVRYPEDLFKVQREQLGRYHVTEAKTFFSSEDAWDVPKDPAEALSDRLDSTDPNAATAPPANAPVDANAGDPQPPYYSLLSLPGESGAQFRLSTSFVYRGRPILAAFASVSSDTSDYGKIRVLQLPKTASQNGPTQVANAFLTDSAVAEELYRFRRNNAEVNFGNLLTLPLSGGLVYVQPVYVQATGNAGYPTLQRVLVAYGKDVAVGRTLDEALTFLLAKASGTTVPAPTTPAATPPASPVPGPSATATVTPQPSADVAAAIKTANDAFNAGQAALLRNDVLAYTAAQAQLQAALQRLTQLQGVSAAPPAATSTPSPAATPPG